MSEKGVDRGFLVPYFAFMQKRVIPAMTVQGIANPSPIGPDLCQILDPDAVKLYSELSAEEPGIHLDRGPLDVHLTHLPLLLGWSGFQMPPHQAAPPHFSDMTETLAEKAESVFGADGQDQMHALLGRDEVEADRDFMARVAERMKQ